LQQKFDEREKADYRGDNEENPKIALKERTKFVFWQDKTEGEKQAEMYDLPDNGLGVVKPAILHIEQGAYDHYKKKGEQPSYVRDFEQAAKKEQLNGNQDSSQTGKCRCAKGQETGEIRD
jgi:hypothetical protein